MKLAGVNGFAIAVRPFTSHGWVWSENKTKIELNSYLGKKGNEEGKGVEKEDIASAQKMVNEAAAAE